MRRKKLKYAVGDVLVSESASTFCPLLIVEIVKRKKEKLTYYRFIRLDGRDLDFPCWPADLVDTTFRMIA